jgi:hypothetical protein
MAKPRMSSKNSEAVCGKLEWEGGLEYLINGSTFDDIKDKHFHKLRKAFVKAATELETYLGYADYIDSLSGD